MSAIPCPQAARAPGVPSPPPLPVQVEVEAIPVLPRQPEQVQALPAALIDPSTRWPYHLPSYNGVDCLWWSMLFRAMYWADSTWLRRVATWAGPIARLAFVDRSIPSRQGYGLVELGDCVLIVIPGTSSEAETLAYCVSHALQRVVSPVGEEWEINATWGTRGAQVAVGYTNWPPPTTRKPIIVVGHSSGGAYGAYTAFRLDTEVEFLTTLATFGAPIWGTPSMRTRYETHFPPQGRLVIAQHRPQIIDFGNPNDFVTTLPPPWALVDLIVPGYTLTDRPVYSRFTNLLQLGNNGAPDPVTQPTSLVVASRAMIQLVTGGGLDVQHAPASYTAAAQRWANNDPSIAAARLTTERDVLNNILVDMNAAGVGA